MPSSTQHLASALLRATLLLSLSLGAGLAPTASAQTSGYIFTTLAGRSQLGGIDGPGDQASFAMPFGVAVDRDGNLFIADSANQTIRKITPDHVVSTYVGQPGNAGSTDSRGFAAQFNYPTGVAVDQNGNLYVADSHNHTIRKVTPDRQVSTLAGLAGQSGSTDGTGSAARFYDPVAVALDRDGNVYVADAGNADVRKITPAGVVTTLAGKAGVQGFADATGSDARFIDPAAVAVDGNGNVYVADLGANTVRAITSAGVVTTVAGYPNAAGSADGTGSDARFFMPAGIAVDADGNLYVTEYKNGTLRKITPARVVTTLAGDPNIAGTEDGTGHAAHFYTPAGAAVDADGNIYLADSGNSTIREVTPAGVVTTVAGQKTSLGEVDGTGSDARFNYPSAVAADPAGNVFVADTLGRTIRKITPAGVVTTFAGAAGQIGSADGQGAAARFAFPEAIAADAAGNVYVGDGDNFTIRKIAPDGTVSVFAGQTGNPGRNDGTGTAAQFAEPAGLAFDGAGNLFVADRLSATIRRITPSGVVTTYAGQPGMPGPFNGPADVARFTAPQSVAVDRQGNVFVGDGNGTIREIAPDRSVTTFAGVGTERRAKDGPLAVARFGSIDGLAIDPLGNIFVADSTANDIRRIDPMGMVTTIAGMPLAYGGTDGSDAAVRFDYPTAVALDAFGNLFVADTSNNSIRQAVSTTRLVNLSVRARVGTGDQTLIVGFVVTGTDPKPLLIRGIGPTLVGMGVPTAVADPEFKVFDHNAQAFLANDDWGGSADLSATFARLGAFALSPASKDAALYSTVAPGLYTTHLYGVDGADGVALVELYDGDSHVYTRLVNVSARSVTRDGDDTLIAGFVLTGAAPKTVLLRGIGPALISQGLAAASVLVDPRLTLFRDGAIVATNDDWAGTAALTHAFQTVGAFALDPSSKDAAMLVTLDPGIYSVHVTGAPGASGVALVEVYETP